MTVPLLFSGCALPEYHLPGGFSSTYHRALYQYKHNPPSGSPVDPANGPAPQISRSGTDSAVVSSSSPSNRKALGWNLGAWKPAAPEPPPEKTYPWPEVVADQKGTNSPSKIAIR